MRLLEMKTVAPDDADLHELIALLDEGMLKLYPAEGIFGVDFSSPIVKEMTFCVAYVNGTPAGCGALKPLGEGTAELKRFFVEQSFRGRGIASLILDFIEGKAREAGVTLMKLETGPKQPEAIGLYKKFGYRKIEPYGEYIGCEHSYCMEKKLYHDIS
jgi:putative acetyltransferase